jgi:hypothetical protein
VDAVLAWAKVVPEDVPKEGAGEGLPDGRPVARDPLGALSEALEAVEGELDLFRDETLAPSRSPEDGPKVVLGEEAAAVPEARKEHHVPSGTRKRAPTGRGGTGSATCS